MPTKSKDHDFAIATGRVVEQAIGEDLDGTIGLAFHMELLHVTAKSRKPDTS